MATLIGLLASTGLRSGEALRLDRADVDLAGGVLTIRKTKFRKDRLILESVFRLAAAHRSFNVGSRECAGNLKTCWTKPPRAPVPLWKLDAASERIAPSLTLRNMLGAVLMAEHCNRDMFFRWE